MLFFLSGDRMNKGCSVAGSAPTCGRAASNKTPHKRRATKNACELGSPAWYGLSSHYERSPKYILPDRYILPFPL